MSAPAADAWVEPVADLTIVGGGLAGCLTALAYRNQHPAARVIVIESAPELAGNHTWCCFASDLGNTDTGFGDASARQRDLLAQVVERRWASHRVRFPSFERELSGQYLCVTAEKLRSVMRTHFAATPGSVVLTGTLVKMVARDWVELADGRRIRSLRVVDARGSSAAAPHARKANADADDSLPVPSGGYQKFLGREVMVQDVPARFAASPLVMDATVAQVDGFRFMYCLPLAADRLLLEDTSFSNGPALDLERSRERIAAYARLHGLRITRVEREEVGILPMPGSGSDRRELHATRASDAGEQIGYAAGLFHSGTGYSLPIAVEVAVTLAAGDSGGGTGAIRARIGGQNRFFERLNRLMFVGVPPEYRRAIFERFYQLPEATIERFYGARTTFVDRARMLAGRPPRGFRWREVLAGSVRSRHGEMASDDIAKTFKEAI